MGMKENIEHYEKTKVRKFIASSNLDSDLSIDKYKDMTNEVVVATLTLWNQEHRLGNDMVPDPVYDELWLELKRREPTHPYLHTVEPSIVNEETAVRHEQPMLSTDKAYTQEEMEKWAKGILKYTKLPAKKIIIKATSKLDGVAIKYKRPNSFVTRGDGEVGNDVSHLAQYALITTGGVDEGVGELVLDSEYYRNVLSDDYKNERGFVSGILGTKNYKPKTLEALKVGALHLVLFNALPSLQCTLEDFNDKWKDFERDLKESSDYATDGVVFEVVNPDIKKKMGSNNSFHRWQIAKKEIKSSTISTVMGITWQVGRTGRLTPVCIISPVFLSGATITNVTGHNYDYFKRKGLGLRSKVQITRSGEVIPKILEVLSQGDKSLPPEICPSCSSTLEVREKDLVCTNISCSGRVKARLLHFFSNLKILEFGPHAIDIMMREGYDTIIDIFSDDYTDMSVSLNKGDDGLGVKTIANMHEEMDKFLDSEVEDYKLITALGIPKCGTSTAKAILTEYRIEELPNLIDDGMKAIYGIGEETSLMLSSTFRDHEEEILFLSKLPRKVIHTKDLVINESSPLNGKRICFTGACSNSREMLVSQLELLGAKKVGNVSKKTDFLVCGKKPTQRKVDLAKNLGVPILTEEELFSYE